MAFNRSILGLDWGLDHPSAVVWLKIDTDKKLIYVSQEFVKAGKGVDEICEAIRFLSAGKVPEFGVIDPSAARRDPVTKRSLVDEFRRCFRGLGNDWDYFSIRTGDRHDRGYEIVKRYLKKGMLKISPKCKNLIYALETLVVGQDTGDDLTDALRYACVNVHDSFQGMNQLTDQEELHRPFVNPEGVRVYNFNDPFMFSDKKEEANDPILEMIYATR